MEQTRAIQPFHFFLKPGYVVANPEQTVVRAVLGNCVAVTLYDPQVRFGGMSHFLYPCSTDRGAGPGTALYGDISIRVLACMMRRMGAAPRRLEAQILGGAEGPFGDRRLGGRNVRAARKALRRLRIPVVDEDVGGWRGRKVMYHTGTNEIAVAKMEHIPAQHWFRPGQDLRFDYEPAYA